MIMEIKGSHGGKVSLREPPSKLVNQALGENLDHFFSIIRPTLALLLIQNNMSPNFEIGMYLHQILSPGNGLTGGNYKLADACIKSFFQFHNSPCRTI